MKKGFWKWPLFCFLSFIVGFMWVHVQYLDAINDWNVRHPKPIPKVDDFVAGSFTAQGISYFQDSLKGTDADFINIKVLDGDPNSDAQIVITGKGNHGESALIYHPEIEIKDDNGWVTRITATGIKTYKPDKNGKSTAPEYHGE